MLILSKNTFGLGATLVASSENVYFPASNVSRKIASYVWRSLGALAAETLTITLDRAYASEKAYLVFDGFDFTGLSGVTYQLGADAPVVVSGWSYYPAAQGGLGIPFVTLINVGPGPYTTLTLTFTKTANANIVQVGKVYFGSGFDNSPLDDPEYGSYKHLFNEGVNKDYSIGGQKYAEARFISWQASFAIPYIPDQQMADTVRNWLLQVGTYQPFWVVIDNNGSIEANPSLELTTPHYCTLTRPAEEGLISYSDSGYLWSLSLSLEQQL